MRTIIINFADTTIALLCNGSTTDSGSVRLGSNPSRATLIIFYNNVPKAFRYWAVFSSNGRG